jgi:membrane-bound metal-dependent hydrolase YbcI (DUF457 family)
MFIGHYAVGFGAKRFAPSTSLGTLFLAAQFIDLLWPTLLLFGAERVRIAPGITAFTPLDFEHYPWSHSLLMVVVWGGIFGMVYYVLRRDVRASLVLAIAVLSHWLLDFLTHRPDLPLWPDATRVGLGLWNSVSGTLVVEVGLFVCGIFLYVRSTRARDATGHWTLWGLVALLCLIYAGNLYGPPPPRVTAIAWVGHAQWLLVAWAYWIDRHREPVASGNGPKEYQSR